MAAVHRQGACGAWCAHVPSQLQDMMPQEPRPCNVVAAADAGAACGCSALRSQLRERAPRCPETASCLQLPDDLLAARLLGKPARLCMFITSGNATVAIPNTAASALACNPARFERLTCVSSDILDGPSHSLLCIICVVHSYGNGVEGVHMIFDVVFNRRFDLCDRIGRRGDWAWGIRLGSLGCAIATASFSTRRYCAPVA